MINMQDPLQFYTLAVTSLLCSSIYYQSHDSAATLNTHEHVASIKLCTLPIKLCTLPLT